MGRIVSTIAVVLLIGLSTSIRGEDHSETLAARIEACELNALNEAARLDRGNALSILTEVMVNPPRNSNDAETRAMRTRAIDLLRQIPGHAELLEDRLEEARDRPDFDRVRSESLRYLRILGTEDAIRVLGSFLFDWSGDTEMKMSDSPPPPPNGMISLELLHALDLPDAPVRGDPQSYKKEDYIAWIRWWENRFPDAEVHLYDAPEWLIPSNVKRAGKIEGSHEAVDISNFAQSSSPRGSDSAKRRQYWKTTLVALFMAALVLSSLMYFHHRHSDKS